MRTTTNFPRCLQELLPLLIACKALGLLPYALEPPFTVVRTTAGVLLSVHAFSTHFLLAVWMLFLYAADFYVVAIGPSNMFLWLSSAMYVGGIVFPMFCAASSLTFGRVARCQRLLCNLLEVERVLGDAIASLPRVVRRKAVATSMMCLTIVWGIQMFTSHLFWNKSLVAAVIASWSFFVVYVISMLFVTMALLIKHFFEAVVEQMVSLVPEMRCQTKDCWKERPNRNKRQAIWLGRHQTDNTYYEDVAFEGAISNLRETFFIVQDSCSALNDLFDNILLFLSAFILVEMVGGMYSTVVAIQLQLRWSEILHHALSSLINVFLMAAVAWAAGSATAAGEGASGAGAALLVAARGRRPLERQVRLFLLQLRARPVCFHLGGIFPLDLRFFTGLLGTIVGYMVIVVQFAQQPPPASCSGENMTANFTCLCDCHLVGRNTTIFFSSGVKIKNETFTR